MRGVGPKGLRVHEDRRGGRLSDEKLNHLSHLLVKAVSSLPRVSFPRGQNSARLRILAMLAEGARDEDALHEKIRQKIASAKRPVPEGSRDWDILFRNYYEEEIARLGAPAAER